MNKRKEFIIEDQRQIFIFGIEELIPFHFQCISFLSVLIGPSKKISSMFKKGKKNNRVCLAFTEIHWGSGYFMGQNDGDYFAGWVAVGWQGELWRAAPQDGRESRLLFCHFFGNKRGQISLFNKEANPPHYKPSSWEALSWTILLGKPSWKKLLTFLFLTYL